jgi:hypothetical protein
MPSPSAGPWKGGYGAAFGTVLYTVANVALVPGWSDPGTVSSVHRDTIRPLTSEFISLGVEQFDVDDASIYFSLIPCFLYIYTHCANWVKALTKTSRRNFPRIFERAAPLDAMNILRG